MTLRKKLFVGALAFLVLTSGWLINRVRAGVSCTLPFVLTNGTIADATQVMANYNALVTCLGSAAAAGAKVVAFAPKGLAVRDTVACPQCGSENTTEISHFGSTACKALYRCLSCMEPFDYFKPY